MVRTSTVGSGSRIDGRQGPRFHSRRDWGKSKGKRRRRLAFLKGHSPRAEGNSSLMTRGGARLDLNPGIQTGAPCTRPQKEKDAHLESRLASIVRVDVRENFVLRKRASRVGLGAAYPRSECAHKGWCQSIGDIDRCICKAYLTFVRCGRRSVRGENLEAVRSRGSGLLRGVFSCKGARFAK